MGAEKPILRAVSPYLRPPGRSNSAVAAQTLPSTPTRANWDTYRHVRDFAADRLCRIDPRRANQEVGETQGDGEGSLSRRKTTLRERVSYAFDNTMAAGPIALIGWLALLSLIGVLLIGAALSVGRIAPPGQQPLSFVEAVWQALMRMIDPGAEDSDTGWSFRVVAIIITFWGIFVFSSLIGLLTAGVQQRVGELRKGRSRILERGHTLILNWSPAVIDVIEQISLAAADAGERRTVAVLAPEDKVTMEDAIAEKRFSRVRVICRSGDPTDLNDLAMVSAEEAQAAVVVSSQEGDPDARNIKSALALAQATQHAQSPCRIVAEFRNSANVEAIRAIGGDRLQAVMADDLIARIIVHASRQSGLSSVYADLLDNAGMEFHIAPLRELAGKTFIEALNLFERAALVGLSSKDALKLNPPMETLIGEDTLGVFIAETPRSIRISKRPSPVEAAAINTGVRVIRRAERAIILGWNRLGSAVASELSEYMTPGSALTIVSNTRGSADCIGALALANPSVRVEHISADPTSRSVIRDLNPSQANHVIILACTDDLDAETADARALVSLMHVRQAISETASVTIVSEVLDVHSSKLARTMRADDFIVSNRLVSLLLAQMLENEHLLPIFTEVLDEVGAEIYMRPVEDYVTTGSGVSFATIVAAAAQRGESAFGYKNAGSGGAISLNPPKSQSCAALAGDSVIVVAESALVKS